MSHSLFYDQYRTLTRTSALAFIAAIALECFYAWDEPTAIATAIVWVISAFFTIICASTLWEGKSLCDVVRVLLSKITGHDETPSGASSSTGISEVDLSKVEIIVDSKA